MSETTQDDAPQGVAEDNAAEPVAPADTSPDAGQEQTAAPAEPVERPDPSAPKEEAPKEEPWYNTRIRQQNARIAATERAREAAEQERDRLRAYLTQMTGAQSAPPEPQQADPAQPRPEPTRPAAPQPPALTEADVQTRAERLAAQMAEQRAFNDACNRVAQDGQAKYSDFAQATQNYGMLGGLQDKPAFLQTITDLPNGADVYYSLGKDPEQAIRVLGMPPHRMALELGKISSKLSAPKPVSAAPRPISPVEGASRGEPDPETMSPSEYAAWRNKARSR